MEKEFNFLIYNSADDNVSVNAIVKDESIWLTQKAMGELFGVQTPAISKHLKNIFDEGELDEKVVVSKMEITTQHGAISDKTQTKEAQFYNLDAITGHTAAELIFDKAVKLMQERHKERNGKQSDTVK